MPVAPLLSLPAPVHVISPSVIGSTGVVMVVDLAKLRVKGDSASRNGGSKACFCKTEHLYAQFDRIRLEGLCMQKQGPVLQNRAPVCSIWQN